MAKPEHEFVIRYKSGAEVTVRADALILKRNTYDDELIEATWRNIQPAPMFIGLKSIESIWQVS